MIHDSRALALVVLASISCQTQPPARAPGVAPVSEVSSRSGIAPP
jgi:hypothetical protein